MISLFEMLSRYSIKYHNKMEVLTRPLKNHFGILYFHFHQVKEDGKLIFITNNILLNEVYFSDSNILRNNPFTVSPKYVKEGYFDWELQKIPKKSCINLAMKEKLGIDRNIKLIIKIEGGYILGSFGFSPQSPYLINLVSTHQHVLRNYLIYFAGEFSKLYGRNIEGVVDLYKVMGGNFAAPTFLKSGIEEKTNKFFKDLALTNITAKYTPVFTRRERECLNCCLEGLTAAQIGNKLFLSRRTVEHRIEQIKAKLGCSKKSEIIPSVRHLEHQGLIIL